MCDNKETKFFQSVEVGFEDIGMILKSKKKGRSDRVILDGSIRGVAKSGRMLAIMGVLQAAARQHFYMQLLER